MNRFLLVAVGVTSLLLTGCPDPATTTFSGIARTDDACLVSEDDPQDWQPRMSTSAVRQLRRGEITVEVQPERVGCIPACPNPVSRLTTFGFAVPETQNVSVRLLRSSNEEVRTLFSGKVTAGVHMYELDVTDLTNGTYRVAIDFEKAADTFGDVLVQR